MYVLALSDYKQPAAVAGYKPAPQLAPQLGRQIAVYFCHKSLFVMEAFLFCIYTTKSVLRNALRKTDVLIIVAVVREPRR